MPIYRGFLGYLSEIRLAVKHKFIRIGAKKRMVTFMKNIEKHGIFFKIALVLGSIAEIAIIIIMAFYGLNWLGNLLESMCNYINAELGILVICLIFMGFIFFDGKNSLDECKSSKKTRKKTAYHNR